LARAGAEDSLIDVVIRDVEERLRGGDSTDAVRRIAMKALRREARHVAGRYDLKRAISKLGPTGYPFERLYGAVLAAAGFSVSFDVTVSGCCVDHEIDVVGLHDRERR